MEKNISNQYINFLKGLAAVCVFVLHFSIIMPGKKPVLFYTPAWVGVWIFFILSGYLIGKGFWNNKNKTDTLKDILRFYLTRFIRIMPIYFFIVLLDLLFINPSIYFNGSETLLRVLTFRLRNPYGDYMIGNLWFVSTIVQLYLITPFVWNFIIKPLKKYSSSMLILLAAGFFLIRTALYKQVSWDYFILPNILTNIDLYFGGFILASLTLENKDNILKQIVRPVSLAALISFIIISCFYMQYNIVYAPVFARFCKITSTTITLILISANLWAWDIEKEYYNFSGFKEKILSVLKNPLMLFNYLGIVSFSFYCCHCQIIKNVSDIFTQKIILPDSLKYLIPLAVSFSFTLLWAILLYFIIEKPMLKLKKYLREKL